MRTFLKHRCEGMSTLEFGIIAPIFMLLLMGMIEISGALLVRAVLDGASDAGQRLADVAQSEGISRTDYIKQEVARLSGGFMSAKNVAVKITTIDAGNTTPEPCISPPTAPCPGQPNINFTDINGNGMWDQNPAATESGGLGAVNIYMVQYPWRIFTPLLWPFFGNSGNITITTYAATYNRGT